MFKKLLVGLIMIGLIFGLSGIVIAKTKVTFLWGTEMQEVHSALESAFEAAYPDIDLEIIAKPPAQRSELLRNWAAAGQLPDVVSLGAGTVLQGYVDGGFAIPLDGLLDELEVDPSIFIDWSIEATTFNDKIYALPWSANFRGFVNYNKTIFDKEGIPYPTSDMTWNELATLAKKLTIKNDKGEIIRYGIFAKHPYGDIVWTFGGRVINEDRTEILFGHEPYLKAIQWYRDLVDQGILMSRQVFADYGGSKPKLFAEEKFVMIITDVGYGGNFSKAGIDFDIVPVPRTEKDCGFPYGFGSYSVSSQSKNPKEAAQFVAWWTTSNEAMEIWQRYLGDNSTPPILIAEQKDIFAKIAEGRIPKNWIASYEAAPYGINGNPILEGNTEIMGKCRDAVVAVVMGDKPVSYLIEAEAECQEMLDKFNAK